MKTGNGSVTGLMEDGSPAEQRSRRAARRASRGHYIGVTDAQCRALAPRPPKELGGKPRDNSLRVAPNLDLYVDADGRKRWTFDFVSPVTGKRRYAGFGVFGDVTLGQARLKADEFRRLIDTGRDPLDERAKNAQAAREAKARDAVMVRRKEATLRKHVRAYHKTIAGEFRNRKHSAQWVNSIEGNLPETLLDKPIGEIGTDELLTVLKDLRARVPETGRRVRQRLDAVFADAVLHKLADGNPAALLVRALRPKARKAKVKHLRACHYRDVPNVIAALRASERVSHVVKLAIEFGIVTAARSGEVRGATWKEIDLEERLWVIPGERMKMDETHRVYLSKRAVEILREAAALPAKDSADLLVFPAPRVPSDPLSDMTLMMALRRLPTGRKRDDGELVTYADVTTMHGLARTTFSTWANSERIAPVDVIEAALAHGEADKVRAAYNRSRTEGDRLERELRALRETWSNFATTPTSGKVLPRNSRRRG
jgi:integrase